MSELFEGRVVRRRDAVAAGLTVPPAVAFGSKFGKYAPEAEKKVRKVEVKEDEVLRQLKDAWSRFQLCRSNATPLPEDDEEALRQIKDLDYSAKDVEKFSIALVEFQDEKDFSAKAGVFLSALINNGKDANYVVHTRHLQEIDGLGYANTKNIVVNGNGGRWVGSHMKCGTITVNANAGILVGSYMKGGTIIVKGDAADVGHGMEGGEIHLEGDYSELDYEIKGGKIYHKGKLIVDK